MGRKAKYELGTTNVTISVPKTVMMILEKRSRESGKSRSAFCSLLLTHAATSNETYHKIMAKYHCAQMNIHTGFYKTEQMMPEIMKEAEINVNN